MCSVSLVKHAKAVDAGTDQQWLNTYAKQGRASVCWMHATDDLNFGQKLIDEINHRTGHQTPSREELAQLNAEARKNYEIVQNAKKIGAMIPKVGTALKIVNFAGEFMSLALGPNGAKYNFPNGLKVINDTNTNIGAGFCGGWSFVKTFKPRLVEAQTEELLPVTVTYNSNAGSMFSELLVTNEDNAKVLAVFSSQGHCSFVQTFAYDYKMEHPYSKEKTEALKGSSAGYKVSLKYPKDGFVPIRGGG